MPVFAYRAIDGVTGTIIADSPRTARDALRSRGITIHSIQHSDPSPAPGVPGLVSGLSLGLLRKRRESKAVAFIRDLATMLAIGVPILESLDTSIRQQRGAMRCSIQILRDDIANGLSLAEAMARQPRLFDELCTSIVEVGESTGSLPEALEQLADFKERSLQFRNKVGGALLYPAIVLMMALGVSIFLMTVVVPRLLTGLLEAGRDVPLATQIVKTTSDALLDWWWLMLIIVMTFVAMIAALLSTENGLRLYHGLILRIPGVGSMVRKQAVVRLSVVLSALLRSGVVFVSALGVAERVTRNRVIRDALAGCRSAVTGGGDIAPALEKAAVFPPTVIQVFTVGQHSGELEKMLDRLALDYDRQLTTAAQRLTTILEPVLILVMVAVVGLIAFATILPMLEASRVL